MNVLQDALLEAMTIMSKKEVKEDKDMTFSNAIVVGYNDDSKRYKISHYGQFIEATTIDKTMRYKENDKVYIGIYKNGETTIFGYSGNEADEDLPDINPIPDSVIDSFFD